MHINATPILKCNTKCNFADKERFGCAFLFFMIAFLFLFLGLEFESLIYVYWFVSATAL